MMYPKDCTAASDVKKARRVERLGKRPHPFLYFRGGEADSDESDQEKADLRVVPK